MLGVGQSAAYGEVKYFSNLADELVRKLAGCKGSTAVPQYPEHLSLDVTEETAKATTTEILRYLGTQELVLRALPARNLNSHTGAMKIAAGFLVKAG